MSQIPLPIRFEFTITPGDQWRTVILLIRRAASLRVRIVFTLILMLMVYVLVTPPLKPTSPGASAPMVKHDSPVIFQILPCMAAPLLLIASLHQIMRKGAKEMRVVILSEDGLIWQRNDSQTENKWPFYTSFLENRSLFFLFHNRAGAGFIPKRGMTPEQIAAVRLLFQSHINKTHAFPILPPK